MAPRKESCNSATAVSSIRCSEDRSEQTQADHELFLQAFEKPTQIYRYLKIRNLVSPTFLHRNLFYMKKRMSRQNENRKNFKVDSLLEKREKERVEREPGLRGGFITITFLGYYDRKKNEKTCPKVRLDLSLVNLTHKKRKESTTPVSQICLGSVEIPVNPSETSPPNKAPAISIPSKHLELTESVGARVKTSTLFFRINSADKTPVPSDLEENIEPTAKRRKMGRGLDHDGRTSHAELTVTDKQSRFQLTEGEYELILSADEVEERKFSPRKGAAWEIIDLEKTDKSIARQFEVFGQASTLKFRLSWASESAGGLVERPRPLMPRDNGQDSGYLRREKPRKEKGGAAHNSSNSHNNSSSSSGNCNGRLGEKPTRIVYQFLYNNNSRQLTEAREDLHCPWCALNCVELVSLLKHLKLCHPRFLFTYVPLHDGARIDVSVSELFDSTYVGNPHDMISQPPGYAFSRNGPVQRTSITNILVFKPKRVTPSLSEFLELEDNENGHFENQRPFVSGHNRLYHNSTTCLPIPPHAIINNLDLDEEDRPDPEWLQIKTSKMIDDFTDVNEGEKEFMKIWNNHVQKYTFVGDCQMPQALKIFIEEKGQEIVQKELFRNFILHLANLFEFGVIGPAHVFTAVTKLQNLIRIRGLQHDLSWIGLKRTSQQSQQEGTGGRGKGSKRKDFAGIFSKALLN